MVKQTIQIFARIKPTKKTTAVYSVDNEDPTGSRLEFLVPRDVGDGFVNNKRESYKFRFQNVFDQAARQEDVFEHIAKPVADGVLAGYNGTIFAYGQTGSGKTFTITGGAKRYADRGIIPRTLSYLYECISQDSGMVYTTHISYLEVYNETGYDLLDSRQEASRLEDLPKVMIMEDPEQNIHLRNLSLQQSANEEEALNLLFLGDTNRMIAETPMNQASTRSHCIFTVHLCRREPGSATLRRSKLHLVDLAGSDRVSKTGLNGQLLTEAKYINLSLHYLEQVIIALSEPSRSHIPYRNSMLTSVLRDSLGGNCMTTMIATMAVDKRNVDESISTCRFAQRVAIIRNEATLNEELDPALLIQRLRREVQALREELVLVTGQQREDRLSVDQVQELEKSVKAFLDDPDPDVTLSLGPDMRKIQLCFSLMKVMILENQQELKQLSDEQMSPTETEGIQHDRSVAAEVTRLKEMLRQRDNEISVLVKMLKKEKRRAEDSAAQRASISDDQDPVSQTQTSIRSSTRPALMEGRNDGAEHEGRALKHMKKGPQLSVGKQEAFETFIRDHEDHEDHQTTEDNKNLLRQRSTEARRVGQQLQETRTTINELKQQLERRRQQRAAHGVMEVPAEAEEQLDPVEENLRGHIEQEKNLYKAGVGRLKALRTEIEHLQLLLERSKVRLRRDFQRWWSQEESGLQEDESHTRCQTPVVPGPPEPGPPEPGPTEPGPTEPGPPEPGPPEPGPTEPGPTEPGPPEPRNFSSSSLLLTGDQQADADIMAFIRARQNLLNRTGAAQK